MPSARGASGPMTAKVTPWAAAKATSSSTADAATNSTLQAAVATAAERWVVNRVSSAPREAEIFHTSACSLPPLPTTRILRAMAHSSCCNRNDEVDQLKMDTSVLIASPNERCGSERAAERIDVISSSTPAHVFSPAIGVVTE